MEQKITLQDVQNMTVNNIPVSSLSEIGQALFLKTYQLQLECNNLKSALEKKTAALEELADMLKGEINSVKS